MPWTAHTAHKRNEKKKRKEVTRERIGRSHDDDGGDDGYGEAPESFEVDDNLGGGARARLGARAPALGLAL